MNTLFVDDPAGRHALADLDVLRGVVILLVFCNSYMTLYQGWAGVIPLLHAVPAVGFLAIQLFLVLSAYRVMLDLSHQRTGAHYLLARALRSLPVPLAMGVAWAAGMGAFRVPLSSIWANLFMVADVFDVKLADPAFWRLKIEFLLAVCAGLAWFGLGARGFVLAILAGLCVCRATPVAGSLHPHVLSLAGAITFDGFLPQCAIGMALCRLVEAPLEARAERLGWWVVVVAGALLVVRANAPIEAVCVLAAFALAGLAASGRAGWLRHARPLGVLGRLSYPVYVVHMVPGFALMRYLQAHHVPVLASIPAACVAAVALGGCVHRWVEMPARKYVPALLARVRLPGQVSYAEAIG
jgi:peptidoglycan/LPS O-acetylase OafA/YrhL